MPYAMDDTVVFVLPPRATRLFATHFARIDDVAAVPWLNDKGQAAYRNFLAHAPPRAFVLGMAGENVAAFGGDDPLTRAMTICLNAKLTCRPYAVNNNVVWVPPTPRRVRYSGFAAIGDIEAVPWVSASSRALYSRFLTLSLPRAFVVAPTGQAAAVQGGYDPLGRALRKCRDAGLACRSYAVDNSVVWEVSDGR